mgnify:CR=1 FL=1
MALPSSVQQAADYAEVLEKSIQNSNAQVTEPQGNNKPEDQVEAEDSVEKLRNRYASLQGKYNAEVPRLHQQTKDLESRIQQLMEENNGLRGEIARREQAKTYIIEQDSDTYGEDMVDLVRRGAREESAKFAAEAASLKGQVEQLRQQMQSQAQATAAQREEVFYSTLTAEAPFWESQNSDPGFLAWLEEADPIYGFQRNEALQRAFNALDAHRVSAIFKEYHDALRSSNPLARQVSPARNRGMASGQPEPRTWSQGEIQAFYDAWRRNQISDEDAQKIEKEIADAVASGRVTG